MAIKIEKEVRILGGELRASAGNTMQIEGYAALFGVESKDMGGFKEVVAPTAFAQTLRSLDKNSPDYDEDEEDVRCNVNHSQDSVLGRTRNGSLTLRCDERGLHFRCTLNKDMQSHRDLHAAVKSGLLNECSFAFMCSPDGQTFSERKDATGKSYSVRTLTNVRLFDVSVVTVPAYPQTSVDARAMRKTPYTQSEIDAIRAKLTQAMNSVIARAENGMDVDAEIEDDDEDRALAGARYVEDEVRQQRVQKVLDSFKHEAVVKWLRGA